MKEIFLKICRDLPQDLRASSHPLGGISIYKDKKVLISIREQTVWNKNKGGGYNRTGKYLISDESNLLEKNLTFSETAELTKKLLKEL